MRWVLVTALVGTACLGACDSDAPALRRAPTGVLTGRVRLADGAELPAYATEDVVRTPLHAPAPRAVPAGCAAANHAARLPVRITPERLLHGIVVGAADFTRLTERKPVTHVVAIEGCRLGPPIVAAMGGDILRVENHDDFAFEPMFGPAFRPRPLRRGDSAEVPLAAGGVESILCPRAAPCGRTDVVVFHHPVFAVSDARGAYRIDAFPAGEIVRVTAWHPLFELEETFVWLDEGERATIDLVLRPKPRFVPH